MNIVPNPGSESSASDQSWHSFTCPVCGHRDRARAGSEGAVTMCSHCQTKLVLGPARPESERITVAVDRSDAEEQTPH